MNIGVLRTISLMADLDNNLNFGFFRPVDSRESPRRCKIFNGSILENMDPLKILHLRVFDAVLRSKKPKVQVISMLMQLLKKAVLKKQRVSSSNCLKTCFITMLIPAMLLSSCIPPVPFHPKVCYNPPPQSLRCHRTIFPELNCEELMQDWGKEMKIGLAFAKECDYYRAITTFKRALVLLPCGHECRKTELLYDILLSYYLAQKYCDVLEFFETSELVAVGRDFPAYQDLLIILYDSIERAGEPEYAKKFLPLINACNPSIAKKLELAVAVREGNFECAMQMPQAPAYFHEAYCKYLSETKSVSRAKLLNTVLPGAGFWYVGQKNTAITALIVNALFIAATYQFFHKNLQAAGIITASLEMGWYIGGIYGGGRAAAEWNEHKYEAFGEKIMSQECLYPQLMLRFAF